MSRYTISQPTEADAVGLARMHEKSWNEVYPSEENGVSKDWVKGRAGQFLTNDGLKKRRGYIQESYDNPGYYFRVAKDENDQVVGFACARNDNDYELEGLYIDASAYGTGLAQQLADPTLEWLGKEHDIKVTVISYNQRAIKFYEKMGFVLKSETERLYKDTPMKVVDMIRKGDKL